jgi:hypothetical protein
VELSWHPPAETKELANYAIISDLSRQGNMLEMASLPFSKETSRRIPIQGDGGRRMTFRVVPRDRRGVYGEAREVSVDIPPLRIHAPSGFAGKVNPDSSVTLRWTYPEDWPVDGFRIKLAGKQIAGEDVLAADARSHTVPYAALGGKRSPRFKIAAVKGPVQSMEVGYAGLLVKPPPPEDIPVVENLKARLVMKDGRPAAEVSWTNVDWKGQDLAGYLLYADDQEEGRLYIISSSLTKSPYVWILPDPDRERYNFRLHLVDRKMRKGRGATTKLDLTKQKGPEK